jgi:RNA polymerase primary sigma factor
MAESIPLWDSTSPALIRRRGPPLARGEELALVQRAQGGDSCALQQLIDANVGLVYAQARRYRCRSHTLEDLVQEGFIGFLAGVQRFDPDWGCRLSTYVLHHVRQSIGRAVERHDRHIQIPSEPASAIRRLQSHEERLHGELGRPPLEREIADASGHSEERIQELRSMVPEPVSYDAALEHEGSAGLLDLIADPNGVDPEQGAMAEAFQEQIQGLVAKLRGRERTIVEERFGLQGGGVRTLRELGAALGISAEAVRLAERRALHKLRRQMEGPDRA